MIWVSIQESLTLRDLERLADICDPSRLREHGDPLPTSVLRDLVELIPCDRAGFSAYSAHSHHAVEQQVLCAHDDQEPAAGPDEILDVFWRHFWVWPASHPERTGDYATVIRDTDFAVSRPAAAPKTEFHRLMECRHALVVPLSSRGPVSHRIVFWRKDGIDFSDREVLLLRLVRPHLAEMRDVGFRHRRIANSALTTRQRELMQLVAGGQTNRQVARHLQSPKALCGNTWRNIYLRLGVTNRVSAVESFGAVE